ncbi:MAG TPA: DNA-formamidopyrimidine glycosylase family protein [Anaerolineales bacterium]|jgi:formamidopyrimidine-DNA glycosylase
MPELPELENVRSQLENRLVGQRIHAVDVDPKRGPIVLRDLTGAGFEPALVGARLADVRRRGKFILVEFQDRPTTLAINPKLAGRLQLCPPDQRRLAATLLTLVFADLNLELRYLDDKQMGQIYLAQDPQVIPTFGEMGPGAFEISRQEFHSRLRRFHGEIKGVLAREQFIAGIGNAYADEILWQAGLHPYRKRPSLAGEEVDHLYDAIRITLLEAGHLAREAMGSAIDGKPRDFFQVHLRGGQPCPRCGTSISEIRARRRVTNFCRTCQPGGLFADMGGRRGSAVE